MSNNRMWLANDRLGVRCLIAKYYPSTGWYPTPHTKLAAAMDSDDEHTQDGPTDWRLIYESTATTEELKRLQIMPDVIDGQAKPPA